MTLETISQLSTLISDSVAIIDSICSAKGTTIPDLNDPFTLESEIFRRDPAMGDAISVATAAAYQLAAILESPFKALGRVFGGNYRAASLQTLMTTHVPEILAEVGPQGLHVGEITKKNQQDPRKIARLLRYLSSTHIFKEVAPDVFAHNRISSILNSGKSPEQLMLDPTTKHDNTSGFPALVELHLDVGGLAARALPQYFMDSSLKLSAEPSQSPFSHAIGAPIMFFDWIQRPEEEYHRRMYGVAMQGVASMSPPESILNGFAWMKLPPGSTIVDVGSGVGAVSLALANTLPSINIILQDVPNTINQAKAIWSREFPESVENGRVKLQYHNFFETQPINGPAVFILKQIIHDWSDKYAHTILKKLREAAGPTTKLVIIDSLISYACPDPYSGKEGATPGSVALQAPLPLLPNFGPVNDMHMIIDIGMLLFHNAQERTFAHMDDLCRGAGWKIIEVHRNEDRSSYLQQLEAVPV